MFVLSSIFLSKQWVPLLSLIISIVSGIASIIAIMSFFKNKAELIQFCPLRKDDWAPIAEGEITFIGDDKKTHNLPSGVLFHYQFLNPSPHDIAFFHLQFETPDKICEFFCDKSISYASKEPTFILHDLIKTGEISLPHKPYGIFKANSLTPMYCFLSYDELVDATEGNTVIRYAIRKFPYLGKKNHYTTFKHYVDLTNLKEQVQSNQEVMNKLTQTKQPSLNSRSKHPHKNKKRKKHR